ncbi:MAG: hypothetical protein H0T76_01345 [Nannocystis sp.]|nr:hypothetical protein [Nannocystis sp.]MBA3545106.1 hypothetical protein [Nannocystis sp.]
MTISNSRTYALLAGGLIAGLAVTAVQGCDADDICGPCGTLAGGSLSISGSAKLDGFFNATATLTGATARIRAEFDANIRALAEVYGMVAADATIDANFVSELVGMIKADIKGSVDGGLKIVYKAPSCEANVSVAVDAQAKCEASAECDVKVDPGKVSVECSGVCEGGCSGSCEGALSCAVKAPSIACEGSCEGACELDVAASCDGTCHGACDAKCSASDDSGQCHGRCEGNCEGTCEFAAAAKCEGKCSGTCLVEQGSASCTAEAECRGSCDAKCSGGCKGEATPPSASANCEATADCQASASAQGNASLECTPPSLEIGFEFNAKLQGDVSAQAAFVARIGELKVRGAAILQGAAKLEALVNGKIDGEVVFNPAPLVSLTASMQGIVSAGVSGDLFAGIPKGRIACVIPAMQEAIAALGKAGGEVGGTIQAQAMFATVFTGG